ncbi:MAG: MOSC domain-containing protein [Flavobacteriaceae bacterium]|nr:MOSC domain-containing protein [Flavobacteriaceae bacterium]
MKIVSTNIAKPKEVTYKGKTVVTGIFKDAINSPIFLDKEQVQGDEISDRKHHGGENQAVYGYSQKHYFYWQEIYPNVNWQFGIFGENLTIDDLDETKIKVGDTFKVGNAVIEATLQRNPCFKLGIRFNDMTIVKKFWNTTMCGVCFKVIQTGNVQVNDILEKIKDGDTNTTIADLYHQQKIEKGLL